MKSIDVANSLIAQYQDTIVLTNLSLNKLVYLAQVEALRKDKTKPLFEDEIEAWTYGPVEPAVYHAFKAYGRQRIQKIVEDAVSTVYEKEIIAQVAEKYGFLTSFDLVRLTHREGGAWHACYNPSYENNIITIQDIIGSRDYREGFDVTRTLAAGVRNVERQFPNALRMLGDA